MSGGMIQLILDKKLVYDSFYNVTYFIGWLLEVFCSVGLFKVFWLIFYSIKKRERKEWLHKYEKWYFCTQLTFHSYHFQISIGFFFCLLYHKSVASKMSVHTVRSVGFCQFKLAWIIRNYKVNCHRKFLK
jgi:hypothetical protein